MLPGKTILVTGCSGLLGPWLCDALLDAGAKVIGIDKQFPVSSRINRLSERIELIEGNVRDERLIGNVLSQHNVSFVHHLAAQALVGVAAKDPVGTFRDNVEGTWTILEAARKRRDQDGLYCGVLVASS